MKKTTGITAFIAASAIVLPAQAAEPTNFYGSVNAGATQLGDLSSTVEGVGLQAVGTFEFSTGYVLEGAVGYDTGPIRIEGEVSWRTGSMDKVTFSGINRGILVGGSLDVDGDVSALSGMMNAWFDIDTGGSLTPFVGGGVGITQISAEINSVSVGGATISFNDGEVSDTVLAWQVGAGLGYGISDSASIQARYKFFSTSKLDFSDSEAQFHDLTVGVLFGF